MRILRDSLDFSFTQIDALVSLARNPDEFSDLFKLGHNELDGYPVGTQGMSLKQIASEYRFYCLLYTSPSPRDKRQSRMPSSA